MPRIDSVPLNPSRILVRALQDITVLSLSTLETPFHVPALTLPGTHVFAFLFDGPSAWGEREQREVKIGTPVVVDTPPKSSALYALPALNPSPTISTVPSMKPIDIPRR